MATAVWTSELPAAVRGLPILPGTGFPWAPGCAQILSGCRKHKLRGNAENILRKATVAVGESGSPRMEVPKAHSHGHYCLVLTALLLPSLTLLYR